MLAKTRGGAIDNTRVRSSGNWHATATLPHLRLQYTEYCQNVAGSEAERGLTLEEVPNAAVVDRRYQH